MPSIVKRYVAAVALAACLSAGMALVCAGAGAAEDAYLEYVRNAPEFERGVMSP